MARPPAAPRAWWAYLTGGAVVALAYYLVLGLNHFGLASMRQQLEMAGGSWQVHSRPGNGTTVTATLPLTMS